MVQSSQLVQVLFTKYVHFLDLELQNFRKLVFSGQSVCLNSLSFETELGGLSESKYIHNKEFWGEYIISREKQAIPKGTSDMRRAVLHFRGAWLPPSVVQAVRGSWALCSIN